MREIALKTPNKVGKASVLSFFLYLYPAIQKLKL